MQRHFCQSEPDSKWNAVTSLTRCFDFLLFSSDVWRYSHLGCPGLTLTLTKVVLLLPGLLPLLFGRYLDYFYILNVYNLLLVLLALLILLVLLALLLLLLDSSNVWRWKFCTSAGCLAAACLLVGKLKGTSLQSHV